MLDDFVLTDFVVGRDRFLPVLEEDEEEDDVDVVAADFLDALDVAFVVVFALALALDTIPTMPNPFVDCEDIFTLDSTPSSVKTTSILEYIVL